MGEVVVCPVTEVDETMRESPVREGILNNWSEAARVSSRLVAMDELVAEWWMVGWFTLAKNSNTFFANANTIYFSL